MPLEIQTIYNAATLNDRYREKLNSLKNDRKTQNINEESAYTTFHDNRCKYLYYWLYTHVLNKKQSIENTLKFTAFGPWIRQLVFKNRNVLDNINEDINDSLQIYERENDYSKTRGYNIAYSS
ncbi:hypothetical protein POVCU2_0078860 [Plasmodium ovale curtisi]|uniref:PIR Superfamily Protein n=1 Tax=Plasmodium ovale curtisi TaxID=864141 RepID=A0A1A8WLK3_PLAOA|nr:hypothetical protein POVCU2_0078860 [Plasmodium ovale curtisi]